MAAVFERIRSEEEDRDSEPVKYEIAAYPADYTLDTFVSKYHNGSIEVPPFQRKFVWSIKQSSRLIESFLLGLPVPPVFLYTEPRTGKLLVVDGQQRILSIVYFFEGLHGAEARGKKTVFKLTGLNKKSPYSYKTYSDLAATNEAACRRLNDSVLRAVIIKQLDPKDDDTSMFHIFERLNNGGTVLVGQEIRNCLSHGPLSALLSDLNSQEEWRKVFGRAEADKRQRDIELILRFMALHDDEKPYSKPMKDFLSVYMEKHRDDSEETLSRRRHLFEETTRAVLAHLGVKPFHVWAGLNVAVFDSVYVAFARNLQSVPRDVKKRFGRMCEDDEYKRAVTSGTTDEKVVPKRLQIAASTLFGA